ncbi:MAG: hypothetical protein AB7S57_06970 [Acetobacteraceae bacterium]
MRQRIDLQRLYADAVDVLDGVQYDSRRPRVWPATCPFSLDQLMGGKLADLEEHLRAASAGPAP